MLSERGYTLIEVLVGLLIFAFLFVGGYTAYRDFLRRQTTDNFISVLRVSLGNATQSAISGVKPWPAGNCDPLVGKTLGGYRVSFTASSYNIVALCSDNYIFQTETNSLPSGYSLQTNPAIVSSYLIKPLGTGTDLLADLQITISDTNSNYSKSITVTTSGVVK